MMKVYKLDSKGKVRVLEVTTNEGNLIQTSGLLDGKKVEHTKLCKPKNIGKVNETTDDGSLRFPVFCGIRLDK